MSRRCPSVTLNLGSGGRDACDNSLAPKFWQGAVKREYVFLLAAAPGSAPSAAEVCDTLKWLKPFTPLAFRTKIPTIGYKTPRAHRLTCARAGGRVYRVINIKPFDVTPSYFRVLRALFSSEATRQRVNQYLFGNGPLKRAADKRELFRHPHARERFTCRAANRFLH
ncbi:hypothetical protein EVAR_49163_1 [Eumeta japonica]|uniref:Uncharacterized protein n=1 Tax=Eumeta variegata TaxID=151549 RepID=A0A4C1YMK6_EUMVA|nr:hypothetical protein EVAR_49163_1 [Eumeta japonica]